MEQVPDDLWRIVFAFAGPTPGARQAAARARTLVEFVEYRLAGAGEFGDWNENTIIKRGVVHTRAQIKLVHDYLKLADAADEIARRDAVLRPLSLALPELRILLHPDESGKTKRGAPCNGWWHARCGYDWTDPVFF